MPRNLIRSFVLATAALTVIATPLAEARPTTSPAASLAVVTTHDVRVGVVALRASGGRTPTAEVRVAIARRVGKSWRESGEMRLRETYFWHTVTGPHALCRLEIVTASSRPGASPQIAVQLLRSPALGCGPTHRFALP